MPVIAGIFIKNLFLIEIGRVEGRKKIKHPWKLLHSHYNDIRTTQLTCSITRESSLEQRKKNMTLSKFFTRLNGRPCQNFRIKLNLLQYYFINKINNLILILH